MELKSSSTSTTRRNSFHGVGAAAAATGGGRRGSVFEPTTFSDPLCSSLNLKETSEFVRSSFPMATTLARSSSSSNSHGRHHEASTTTNSSSSSSATSAQRRRGGEPPPQQQQAVVVPATPGRPLQFFTSPAHHHQLVAPRSSVPSKWEDAEKWLRQSSDSDHGNGNGSGKAAFSSQRSSGLGHRGGAGGDDEKRAAVTVKCSSKVKIQKMRSNLEEKLMRRMTTVPRRAEEWSATAQAQHLQQLGRAAADNTQRLRATSHHRHLPGSDVPSCACFPCSNNITSSAASRQPPQLLLALVLDVQAENVL